MINPITACEGCGTCPTCVAQLPPLGGPPGVGAPHEAADRAVDQPVPPAMGAPHETAERAAVPPHDFDFPLVGGIATAEPTITQPQDTQPQPQNTQPQPQATPPATYEVPVVPVEMPLDTIAPLGLEDQY